MYTRNLTKIINKSLKSYQIITLLGPRQSGKTTLAKFVGGDQFDYINLEDLSLRSRIAEDPKSFFHSINKNIILDEIQQLPDLLSYLQVFTDRDDYNYKFILTGSNSLLLSDKISQSLAGRTRIFNVLPMAMDELPEKIRPKNINEAIYKGMYPRIYKLNLNPTEWIGDYLQTYVQKDVRQLLNIDNLLIFDKFLRLCAGRVGQILNYTSLSNEIGISVTTIQSWISVLEASFIAFRLAPHYKNFNKRITKAPKLYFYDTGLVVNLLNITKSDHVTSHPLRGSFFENWIIAELVKQKFNDGKSNPYFFWRDQHGHEIDLIEDQGINLYPIEIKSSQTYHKSFSKMLHWFNKLQDKESAQVIYGGDESFVINKTKITSWLDI